MSIQAGGSAVKGVYLGDELLTGGGDLDGIIQTAISKPVSSDLGRLLTAPTEILKSEQAMTALATDKAALDAIVANPNFNVMVQAYPEIRTILDSSPYKADYLPGPLTLKTGDMSRGFYGEATMSELGTYMDGAQQGKAVDGDTLAAQFGITAGTGFNKTTNWLKFIYGGYIYYIAMNPIRYDLSWNNVNAVGAITGTAKLKTTRLTADVIVLTGGKNTGDIPEDADTLWDRLLRACLTGGYFLQSYSANNLYFKTSGNGYYQMCQETSSGDSTKKIFRYGASGESASYNYPHISATTYGWRPALRLAL